MRSAWQLAWRLVRGTIGQNRDLQFWEFYSGPISHRFETPYVGFVEPLQSGVPDLPSPLVRSAIWNQQDSRTSASVRVTDFEFAVI